MVDIPICEDGAADRRLAQAFAGTQFGSGFDLGTQVGRSPEQKPRTGVGADAELRLGAGFAAEGSSAQDAAIGAGAIPLGESPASPGAENLHAHDFSR